MTTQEVSIGDLKAPMKDRIDKYIRDLGSGENAHRRAVESHLMAEERIRELVGQVEWLKANCSLALREKFLEIVDEIAKGPK